MNVYLLQHSYEYDIYKDVKTDEVKIIGIYSSQEKAEEVKTEFMKKKGFNKFSGDCFYIDEYQVDKDNWTEGFITWDSESDDWVEE